MSDNPTPHYAVTVDRDLWVRAHGPWFEGQTATVDYRGPDGIGRRALGVPVLAWDAKTFRIDTSNRRSTPPDGDAVVFDAAAAFRSRLPPRHIDTPIPHQPDPQAFWLVWRENGGPPTVRHDSHEAALTEAKRLAEKCPGEVFLVLEAMTLVTKPVAAMVVRPHVNGSSIPF